MIAIAVIGFQSLQEYPKRKYEGYLSGSERVSNPYRNILSRNGVLNNAHNSVVSNPYRNILSGSCVLLLVSEGGVSNPYRNILST